MMPRLTLYTNGPLLNRHVTSCTASRRLSPERISPGSTSEPMTCVAGLRGAAAGRSPPDGPRTARGHIGLERGADFADHVARTRHRLVSWNRFGESRSSRCGTW